MKFATHRFRLQRPSSPEVQDPPAPEDSSAVLDTDVYSGRKQCGVAIPPPACTRCRQHKKKCSKTLPSCKSCMDVGRKCSYFDSRQSLLAPAHVLQARIQWLTQYIEDNFHAKNLGTPLPSEQRRLSGIASTSQEGEVSPTSGHRSSVGHDSIINGSLPEPEHGGHRTVGTSLLDLQPPIINKEAFGHSRASVSARMSPNIISLSSECIDAYFHHVHRAYPFVDKERIMQEKRSNTDVSLIKGNPGSMLLFLVHAIGCTSLERSGKIPSEVARKLQVPYLDILQYCITDGSVDSVRVLVLLALYSLFDPGGIQTWTIVGIITRQTMILSLARRDTTVDASSTSSVESLHRLFWSVYALDRMVAVSVGQHPGLPSENIDIPLPAVTVDEFASHHRSDISSMLQVSHHVIQLRRLESKILESIHLCDRTQVSSTGSSDRTAIRDNIQYEIDNWYSAGCLIARPDTRNVRIHDTMAWLNARYYQLLLTLYYPCHFNRRARPISNEKLLSFVGKYIHYDHVLLEQRQLPLNYITLCRLVPVSLVLIHCFACSVDTVFPAKGEIQSCIAILRAFPDDWHYAHSIAQLMTEFALFVSTYETRTASGLVVSRTVPLIRPVSDPSLKTWLEALRKQVITIGGQVLGKSNCFQYIDEWDEAAQPTLPESHHPPPDYLSGEPPSIQGLLNDQLNTEIEFGFL